MADGYESYQNAGRLEKRRRAGSFCLMPKESESTWDIRDDLSLSTSTAPMTICAMWVKNLGQTPAVVDAG